MSHGVGVQFATGLQLQAPAVESLRRLVVGCGTDIDHGALEVFFLHAGFVDSGLTTRNTDTEHVYTGAAAFGTETAAAYIGSIGRSAVDSGLVDAVVIDGCAAACGITAGGSGVGSRITAGGSGIRVASRIRVASGVGVGVGVRIASGAGVVIVCIVVAVIVGVVVGVVVTVIVAVIVAVVVGVVVAVIVGVTIAVVVAITVQVDQVQVARSGLRLGGGLMGSVVCHFWFPRRRRQKTVTVGRDF